MRALSKADHERLNIAIAEAEDRTKLHIAVVVVPASDRYVSYPLAYGALFALALGGALALVWPHVSIRLAFVLQTFGFALVSVALDWLPVRLRLVPRHVKRTRAHTMAHREFAARILTTHKGGMLLFVSLGERYVELMADRDLHARVGQSVWDDIVGTLTRQAGEKPLGECLLAAIKTATAAVERN